MFHQDHEHIKDRCLDLREQVEMLMRNNDLDRYKGIHETEEGSKRRIREFKDSVHKSMLITRGPILAVIPITQGKITQSTR